MQVHYLGVGHSATAVFKALDRTRFPSVLDVHGELAEDVRDYVGWKGEVPHVRMTRGQAVVSRQPWGVRSVYTGAFMYSEPVEIRNYGFRSLVAVTSVVCSHVDQHGVEHWFEVLPGLGNDILMLGSVVREPEGNITGFVTLLREAGPDVGEFAPLEPLVVEPRYWNDWLDPAKDCRDLLAPARARLLQVKYLGTQSFSTKPTRGR